MSSTFSSDMAHAVSRHNTAAFHAKQRFWGQQRAWNADAPAAPIGSLSAVDREELRRQLVAKLEIEKAHGDVRLVTLNGVVLGRLGQNRDTGYWELDWREGWRRLSSGHAGSGEAEHAETWAVEEIANLIAVERSAIDAGGSWGRRSPPPGVS